MQARYFEMGVAFVGIANKLLKILKFLIKKNVENEDSRSYNLISDVVDPTYQYF